MGLENGIVLATHHKINMDDIPEYIVIEEDDWRNNDDDYNDGYYYDVEADSLKKSKFIKVI